MIWSEWEKGLKMMLRAEAEEGEKANRMRRKVWENFLPIAKMLNEIKSYWHFRPAGRYFREWKECFQSFWRLRHKNLSHLSFHWHKKTQKYSLKWKEQFVLMASFGWRLSWGFQVSARFLHIRTFKASRNVHGEKLNNWISNFKAIEDWFSSI